MKRSPMRRHKKHSKMHSKKKGRSGFLGRFMGGTVTAVTGGTRGNVSRVSGSSSQSNNSIIRNIFNYPKAVRKPGKTFTGISRLEELLGPERHKRV